MSQEIFLEHIYHRIKPDRVSHLELAISLVIDIILFKVNTRPIRTGRAVINSLGKWEHSSTRDRVPEIFLSREVEPIMGPRVGWAAWARPNTIQDSLNQSSHLNIKREFLRKRLKR